MLSGLSCHLTKATVKLEDRQLEYSMEALVVPFARRCKVMSSIRGGLFLPDNVRSTRWAEGSFLDTALCAGVPTQKSIDRRSRGSAPQLSLSHWTPPSMMSSGGHERGQERNSLSCRLSWQRSAQSNHRSSKVLARRVTDRQTGPALRCQHNFSTSPWLVGDKGWRAILLRMQL